MPARQGVDVLMATVEEVLTDGFSVYNNAIFEVDSTHSTKHRQEKKVYGSINSSAIIVLVIILY